MSEHALALIPLTSGVFYLGLLRLLRGRVGARVPWSVQAFLAVMAATSFSAAVWRVTQGTALTEPLLRSIVVFGMLSGATFLLLVQAQYPTRWSRRSQVVAYTCAALTTSSVLSGALNNVMINSVPNSPLWMHILAYSGMMAWVTSYFSGFAYVAFSYRSQRDPFERNRLKYTAVAALLIFVGATTNLVDALQKLPIDQAANVAAATLIAFTIVRYRLFAIEVALQRGIVRVIASVPIMAMMVGFVSLGFPSIRSNLFTASGVATLLAIGAATGVIAPLIRARIERLSDRIFVGGHIEHREAVMAFTRRSLELHDIESLARQVTELCQWATDSGCVAILLPDGDGARLRLARMSGPFAQLQPAWTIQVRNPVLRALHGRGEPITPYAFGRILAESSFEPADVAEFGPYRESIICPIVAHGEVVGCLFVAPKVYNGAFSLEDLDLLATVAAQAGVALQNATLIEQLQARAQTDFLTQLPNHRHMQEVLTRVLSQAAEQKSTFSIAMVDIDNFKLLNDVHGHTVGDDALRMVARHMRDMLPPEHTVARYGGDEFLVVMPGLEGGQASEMMARIARGLRKLTLVAPSAERGTTERLPARVSWGVAAFPDAGDTTRALVSVADSALMQQRFSMRRSGTVHTERPTVRRLLEQDPEKLRIARALLDIIDAKDPYTSEHSQQIAAFALLAADEMGLGDRDRYALWLGSLLHDVGKIGTPAYVLRKPGRLSPEEWDLMRLHPMLGEQMVRGLLDMTEVIDIVGCHHEKFDGSGYPRGLAGEDIPRLARLVSVADAFSAMVHDRPYRKGLSWPEAVAELRRFGGTQFDPEMVELFVRAIGHEEQRAAA